MMKRMKLLSGNAAEVRCNNAHLVTTARILSLFLVVVAGLDVISTNAALAAGHMEGNPVLRAIQADLGAWWSIPKIGVHLILGLLILWHPSLRMVSMACLVVVGYIAIIINNFHIAGWLT